MTTTSTGRVIVGADGSPSSRAAAEWAARYAELTGSVLHLVTAWEWPANFGYPLAIPGDIDPGREAGKALDEMAAQLRVDHPAVEIHTFTGKGYAPQVLVEASSDADLLVVGSRGHGELAGVLLGSVSQHCAAHAHCPVVVYRS